MSIKIEQSVTRKAVVSLCTIPKTGTIPKEERTYPVSEEGWLCSDRLVLDAAQSLVWALLAEHVEEVVVRTSCVTGQWWSSVRAKVAPAVDTPDDDDVKKGYVTEEGNTRGTIVTNRELARLRKIEEVAREVWRVESDKSGSYNDRADRYEQSINALGVALGEVDA